MGIQGIQTESGGFPELEVPSCCPHDKDYNVFWFYMGVPLFRETTIQLSTRGTKVWTSSRATVGSRWSMLEAEGRAV